MNVWWCNQGQCWEDERPAKVVCSEVQNGKQGMAYREMVKHAKKGDVVVHYVSPYNKSILAISRAKTNAKPGTTSLKHYNIQRLCCMNLFRVESSFDCVFQSG